MNARLTLLLLGSLAAGCTVPTLADLETQHPYACDELSRCAVGYSCVKGTCLLGEGRVCLEGDERPCGTQVGECTFGTERCNGEGRFDGCDASRIVRGPAYEAEETLCDDKDNDCDGLTDEGLFQVCPLTQGVCAGARAACVDGAWETCGAGNYLAVSSAWQPEETLCDDQDNDCDGVVDGTRRELVPSPGHPRNATAVRMGGVADPDVMLAWEQVDRVLVRRVNADGGLGPPRYPAITVEKNLESWGPAFAECDTCQAGNCNCHLAAWFDRYSCQSPSGSCSRLVGGILNEGGWTGVGPLGDVDAGVVTTLFGEDNMGRGGSLQLVMRNGRVAGVFTASAADGGSTVRVISCPASLNTLCVQASLGAGEMPTVALSPAGDVAAVAWRRDGGVVVSELLLTSPSWAAAATLHTVLDVAQSADELDPRLLGDPSGRLRLYSLRPATQDGGSPSVVARTATAPCAGGSCVAALAGNAMVLTASTDAGTRTVGGLAALEDVAAAEDLLAWQEGTGASAETWLTTYRISGLVTPLRRVAGSAEQPLLVQRGTVFVESAGAIAQDLACHP